MKTVSIVSHVFCDECGEIGMFTYTWDNKKSYYKEWTCKCGFKNYTFVPAVDHKGKVKISNLLNQKNCEYCKDIEQAKGMWYRKLPLDTYIQTDAYYCPRCGKKI